MSAERAAAPSWWRVSPTLRRRVLLVLLTCLLVSCVAVGLATTLALRRFLLDRLDQQLADAGARYATSLEHPSDNDGDDGAFGAVVGQPSGTLGARVANGKVTAFGVIDNPSATGSAQTLAKLARFTGPARPTTLQLDDLGEYRVLVTAGRDNDLLITGLPEHPVDETITHLLWIEAIVFAAALAASAIVASGLVRVALRPLTRVARTALQVSNLPLASGDASIPDRVDDPAPGTEVGQVAEAFNHMLEHVENSLVARQASEERLRKFVADASHELRTPVAVVRSHAEYAQRVGDPADREVRKSLERIIAESNRMATLVDDLLLLARLDSGRPLERAPVDLTRLALDAVRDAQVAGDDHRWRLDLPDEPVAVVGDANALHQALANLLANARLHTPSGTTVTTGIAVSSAAVELSVADDGPGVPIQLQSTMFERLVHGNTRAGRGSGLGLSIVAAIAAAHDGVVRVESAPGHTVFTIALPPFGES